MSISNEVRYLASHEWGRIDEEGILNIEQNTEGLDTEDRVVKLVECINSLLQKK